MNTEIVVIFFFFGKINIKLSTRDFCFGFFEPLAVNINISPI